MEIIYKFFITATWLYLAAASVCFLYWKILDKNNGKYALKQKNDWHDLINSAGWVQILFSPKLALASFNIVLSQLKMFFKAWRLKSKMESCLKDCLWQIDHYQSGKWNKLPSEWRNYKLKFYAQSSLEQIKGLKYCQTELGWNSPVLNDISAETLDTLNSLSQTNS